MSLRHCCSRGEPLRPRAVGVGDVVDLPAEAVDLEHRLALRRAAGCASRHRTSCRTRWCRNSRWPPPSLCHAPAAGFDTGRRPIARRAISPAMPPRLCASIRASEMHALAQRIAHLQHAHDLVGKGLDHRDLEAEPEILHLGAERPLSLSSALGPHRERLQALQHRRRRFRLAQHLDRRRRLPPAHRAAGRRDRDRGNPCRNPADGC